MASNIEFIEFISSQLEDLGYVRCRKMFGDYMIYLDEKPIILVCDNISVNIGSAIAVFVLP